MDLHNIREEYTKQQLSKKSVLIIHLHNLKMLNEAIKSDIKEPTAMNLATVNDSGQPSSRIVLLKEVNSHDLFFLLTTFSQKR